MTSVRQLSGLCSTLAAEVRRDGGRVLVEYGLVLAGVAVVGAVSVRVFGSPVSNLVMTLLGSY